MRWCLHCCCLGVKTLQLAYELHSYDLREREGVKKHSAEYHFHSNPGAAEAWTEENRICRFFSGELKHTFLKMYSHTGAGSMVTAMFCDADCFRILFFEKPSAFCSLSFVSASDIAPKRFRSATLLDTKKRKRFKTWQISKANP